MAWAFNSPLSRELRTNYVPDEAERVEIEQYLQEPERRMADFEKEMTFRQRALEHFTTERDRLQSVIQQHRVLLSPVRVLPNDILLSIFLFCLPVEHNAVMDPTQPPMVLGLVCSRWRFIAYNSPHLWASLHIPLPRYPSYPAISLPDVREIFQARMFLHQAAIRQWLTRSRSRPLSVSLYVTSSSWDGTAADDYLAYLVLLISFFYRIRVLEVTLPSGYFYTFFASLTPEQLPMLETLRLSFVDDRPVGGTANQQDKKWTSSGLLITRTLREMHLIQFPSLIPYLEINWRLLTSLDIIYSTQVWRDRGFTLNEAYAVLAQCSNLVHLGIELTDPSHTICPLRLISLPHLHSLTLLDAAYNLASLLDRMLVPNLKCIRYETKYAPSPSRRSPLLVLLASNNQGTEQLTMNVEFLSLPELNWCFFYAPNLTHFSHVWKRVSTEQAVYLSTLRGLPVDFIRAFLELLIPNQQGIRMCSWPGLTHVYVKGANPAFIDDAFIKRFIDARRRSGDTKRRAVQDVLTPASLLQVEIEFGHGFISQPPVLNVNQLQSRLGLGPGLASLVGASSIASEPMSPMAVNFLRPDHSLELVTPGRFERGLAFDSTL
ncbi:hypothetical protein CPB84DRAFT_1712934 [Gymnopilus junonius]|uniref:F-box domain-containing protein n=1 Tax=Gymnopilus junonius TaxID=109634 RepID=A0A9P5NI22_GYMJU|nr:hypothetical protein CPB84DRAFT_1712934 [Gymnopilus junonius]